MAIVWPCSLSVDEYLADGVDYLRMVAAAHDEEAGTGQKPDFAQLDMFGAEDEEQAQ